MTLNILFLPLLGGFLFYHIFNGTSHLAFKHPPQTVLFWSAAIGIVLLFVSRELVFWIPVLQRNQLGSIAWVITYVVRPALLSLVVGLMLSFVLLLLEMMVAKSQTGIPVTPRTVLARFKRPQYFIALIIGLGSFAILLVLAHNRPPNFSRLLFVALFLILMGVSIWWANYAAMPMSSAAVRVSVLLIMTFLLFYFSVCCWSYIVAHWMALRSPIENSRGLGTSFLACILGPLCAYLLNQVYTKETAEYRYRLSKWPSKLEQLIYSAARLGKAVMITMDDRKVYAGLPINVTSDAAAKQSYIVILPRKSGYRDKDSLAVTFTTEYEVVHSGLSVEQRNEFAKILPLENISSAGYFEEKYYVKFPNKKTSPPRIGPNKYKS